MAKFRKKPVVIEARQWLPNRDSVVVDITNWLARSGADIKYEGGELTIKTLEGVHHASAKDWIIRGVQGEFYPCKPDIFEATYDAVET